MGILIGIIIGVSIILIRTAFIPRPKRVKPDSIPVSAFLIGGYDGYYWIDLVEIRNDTIRFNFYNYKTNLLVYDADFILDNCGAFSLTKSNWSDHVVFFDDRLCNCTILLEDHYCQLTALQPAYFKRE
ncbi:MAG: hypothetical protein ACPKM0_07860 [Pleomorphochaeta sp.]